MKIRHIGLCCFAFLATAFFLKSCNPPAQAGAHAGSTSWGASPTPGIAGYHIWRANCTGAISGGSQASNGAISNATCTPTPALSSFSNIGMVGPTVTSYVDSTVTAGQQVAYYETAFCPASGCGAGVAGESSPGPILAGTAGNDQPTSVPTATLVMQ